MSTGVMRTALLGLLGLLVVILGCLIAFAFVIRRRPAGSKPGSGDDDEARAGGQAGAMAYVVEDPMVCPACRREFEPGLSYCPHDAARLVPAPQMLERLHGKHQKSSICPRCRRAFEGRVRFCPHDGSDLLPVGVYQATHGSSHDHDHDHDHDHGEGAEGIIAKICPECQGRYGYTATFCGKDGVELVVLN
jgi:hypothetical protein